jgi:cysteine-S-conjugate beta-lyase
MTDRLAARPDFDTVIDFRATPYPDSLKWNRYAGREVLPLWVADMDFAAPPPVVEALHRRVAQGVFGYSQPWPALVATVQDYLERQYRWRIESDWIVWLPGLVTGLNVACRAVSGDVVTATPIYPPFLSAPALAGRRLGTVPLVRSDGHWTWNFPALAAALTPTTKLLLLCHPHNPVGRAWDDQELQAIADLAERHDLIVCSDEIHCDLMLAPRPHRPFATLDGAASRRSITLMAPSKAFNVPGLGCAFAIIPEASLRRDFHRAMSGIVPHVNTLGLVACEAALRDAGDWHAALIQTLRGNAERVAAAVAAMPGLSMTPVEATYLAWIDTSGTGLEEPQRFFEAAGVGLSAGADFGLGSDYRHFVRLNFGCPRATLDAALERMQSALQRHTG